MTLVYVRTRGGRVMVNARIGIAAASIAVVAGGLLAALGATAAGAASGICATPGKCFLTTLPPSQQSVAAGASQQYTFTVTNEATTQTLGSVQLTAPPGFVISSASGPAGSASSTATSALFLNLGLSPTQSATLTVTASAPCGGGTSAWSVQAKQSNQFNGPNNTFVVDPNSSLGVTVSGSCSLAFLNEPNGTQVGAHITTQVASSGSPVSVEVLDGHGNLITTSTAAITVAIGANPGPGALSGTTTVNAFGGVASFPDLSINQAGTGYTLQATSPGITQQPPATSSDFNIWSVLQSCSGQCSGSSSSKTTTGTVTTSSGGSGEFLGLGLGGASFSCGSSYQPLSDPLSFDVLDQTGTANPGALFTTVLEISKSVVQSSGHPGASTWQICYGSQQPFTALPNTAGTATIGGVTYMTGLLPDCNNTASNPPCVLSRNKDNAGNVIVTFLAVGDPFART
jgi:hypothetical protein